MRTIQLSKLKFKKLKLRKRLRQFFKKRKNQKKVSIALTALVFLVLTGYMGLLRQEAVNEAYEAEKSWQMLQTTSEERKRLEERNTQLQQQKQELESKNQWFDQEIKTKSQELEQLKTVKVVKLAVATRPKIAGNTYTKRNCTFYAKSRRPDLPNNLGNANRWVARARAQGFTISDVPKEGAIGQTKRGMHVVVVESVVNEHTIIISEMNYDYRGSLRTRQARANEFTYIL